MPITPFHGGIGLACKGPLSRRFSFTIFVATQVVIDLESAYFLVTGGHPVHRFFHTFLGATVVCLTVALFVRSACASFLRFCNRRLGGQRPRWLNLTPEISLPVAIFSAAVGVVGHVVPDAIMHADVRPFAPFSDRNPLLDVLSLTHLHVALALAGAAGLTWMLLAVGKSASS